MERNNVITNYKGYTDNELIDTSRIGHSSLKASTYFIFPEGQLNAFNTCITTFADAKVKAGNGGKIEIYAKNVARINLENELTDITRMVNQQAKGDLTVLKSAGFPLYKEPESYPEFPAPSIIKLKSGIAHGEIVVEVPAVKRTRMYFIYHAPVPVPEEIKDWNSILSTKHKARITGLTPGTQQAVRAGYIGTNGKINLSEIFTIYVQ